MPEQLDLTIVYEPGEEGWIIASIPEVSGVFSQGRTRDEARANVIDALRLMLSPEPGDPIRRGRAILKLLPLRRQRQHRIHLIAHHVHGARIDHALAVRRPSQQATVAYQATQL
ncbi:MAG TPA: type II toxin-antitoxin system HicB family antitoxin [Solirubrobacteraceae bacterium]|jgi:predicted RNase H-like HicB family nuclease